MEGSTKKNHHLTYTWLRSQNHHLIFEKKTLEQNPIEHQTTCIYSLRPIETSHRNQSAQTLMVFKTDFFIGHILRQTTSISQPKVLTVHESNLFGIGWLPP